MVNQSPTLHGINATRWTLGHLQQVLAPLKIKSTSGVWNYLKRFKIHYKRARLYVHSPDVNYSKKLEYIASVLNSIDPEKEVVLCLDELTIYSSPSIAQAYCKQQPLAQQGYNYTKTLRVAGAINLLTGKVSYLIRNKLTITAMKSFYIELQKQYPNKKIYIVQDNWPIHYHPEVLGAFENQDFSFPIKLPDSWKKLTTKLKTAKLQLPIQVLPLPTYASWLNPIEKLWRKMKQELIHLHTFKDDWNALKDAINKWLHLLSCDTNHSLLQYIGMNAPNNFFRQIFATSSHFQRTFFS